MGVPNVEPNPSIWPVNPATFVRRPFRNRTNIFLFSLLAALSLRPSGLRPFAAHAHWHARANKTRLYEKMPVTPPIGCSTPPMTPRAASRAQLSFLAATISHTNVNAHPQSPAHPSLPELRQSNSPSRKRPPSLSIPAASPARHANGSQTGSSLLPQSTNAPNCARAAPSHSPPARRCTQKIQLPAHQRNSILPSHAVLPIPPRAAISRPGSAPAQSTTAGFPRDDDSPPADKTPSRRNGCAPRESKAPAETRQNFPAAVASWGIPV